jgi:hypothetical protein
VADNKAVDRVRLADEVSIGLLATVFPDERVVAAIEAAGVKEQRNRALLVRLMVYFALALWLDFGKGSASAPCSSGCPGSVRTRC